MQFLPLTVSLETAGGIATPIILRGTPLPARREQNFSTYEDDQSSAEISTYIGERKLAADNLLLNKAMLKGIPPMKKGIPEIHVVFEIKPNLELTILASEKKSGVTLTAESKAATETLTAEKIR